MAKLVIDVVTDIVCPWCFIGVTRLEKVLAALGVEAAITHHPFFLDPNLPPEGVDVAEMLRRKYGGDPSTMFARVEAEARKSGIPLDLSKQPRQRPTTAAHTLVRMAGETGRQEAVAMALFKAHFLASRNVADPDVLVDVAIDQGLDGEAARRFVTDPAELELTRRAASGTAGSGIGGVPFFVFDRRLALSGCQPEDVFERTITQALATTATVGA
ncbi:DsbA family oxidoreductase [Kaistia dalseonensis]|uniref:DsbA family dithiol-disulfide isomerase n=1 Tax=Kaistia dalseonensis TaxID=410840 RepID=A0ABU0H297_9HYPH|nr:DsbA family oxidoreductase [Kaistia dalseonensis]MCX5493865.1 DsbA family oxidoreductase [Kaistia dalseonensis]MDQ0436430.1 putative DsbA family dithiol-disulfide isomerase [Kaistia dalseonensis]